MPKSVTVSAPINMALIKYWGKRDEAEMLPLNDSISVTIDALRATSTVRLNLDGKEDSVTINGIQLPPGNRSRFDRVFKAYVCFQFARQLLQQRNPSNRNDDQPCFELNSTTNFPIEAGLASSAAGFAALAIGLGHLCNFKAEEAAKLARLGSGSACRSVMDGFVHWKAGQCSDGSDCYCERIAPIWSDLRAVIVVTSNERKAESSKVGMQNSVRNSALLPYRVEKVVPERVERLIKAIHENDFGHLAEITMADSNQLHAILYLQYLNTGSWHLIRLVERFNQREGQLSAAYSFDAGPNCCIFVRESQLRSLLACIVRYCPTPNGPELLRNNSENSIGYDDLLEGFEPMPNLVQTVIVSTVGGGITVSE